MLTNIGLSKKICSLTWKKNRLNLLKSYWQLIEQLPINNNSLNPYLTSFYQNLIDYTAYGHFKIYPMILDQCKCSKNLDPLINKIYKTTLIINKFNYLYENNSHSLISLKNIKPHLSQIGFTIASRLEIEDHLYKLSKKLINIDAY